MAADFETIKDYLVGIGFSVNQQQLKKFTGVLEDIGKKVEVKSASMGSNFAKAGGVMVATITSIVGATALLMDKVAKSDMGYQLYGMRMYTNTEVAKKMKIAIDALGYSMEEIVNHPELNERFGTLIADQIRLQKGLPSNFKQSMTDIREIDFQFTRLKVKLMWFMDGLAGKLAESLGLEGWDELLEKLNDWFEQKIPIWTDNVANFIKDFKEKWSELTVSFDSDGVVEQFRKMRITFKELKEDWDSIDGTSLAWKGFKQEIEGVALAFAGVGRTLAQTADVYVRLAAHDYKGAVAAGLKIYDFSTGKGVLRDIWDSFGKLKTWEQMEKEEKKRSNSKGITGSNFMATLMKLGWTKEQAAGIVGNIMQESSGNPSAQNSSGHYGLFQLSKERQQDFKKWAGRDIHGADADLQLAFAHYELTKGKEKRAGDLLRQAKTPFGAAMIVSKYYERPGASEANNSMRATYANRAFGSTTTNSVNVGDITVNVAETNATGEEISNKLIAGIQKKMSINTLLRQYEVAGVYR